MSGEVIIGNVDTLGPLTEAFALAAIARPSLVAGTAPGREMALERTQSLITAVDQALTREERWLARHGCPADDAQGCADNLKKQLADAEKAARADLELEIRTSPVRRNVQDEVSRRARAAFRERDVVGALFARAGKTAEGGEGLQPLDVPFNADRRWFTSADAGWAIGSLGSQLGAALAVRSLQYFHLIAVRGTEVNPVRREDAAVAVREAIADLSASPAGEQRRHPTANRLVVLIPDLAYDDREALQIGRPGQNGHLATAASRALRHFGLETEGLAAQVRGIIDEAPVIQASVRQINEVGLPERNIVVIDLARFGVLRRGAAQSSRPPEPALALYEPSDPLRPDSGDAPAPVVGNPPGPLQVQVTLSLLSGIDIEDRAAVRVVRIE